MMRTDAAQAIAGLADTETVLLKGVQLPATEPASPAGIADAAELAAPGVVDPVYPEKVRKNIQGNIIPGFNKNHQQFLFLRFGEIGATRDWLRGRVHKELGKLADLDGERARALEAYRLAGKLCGQDHDDECAGEVKRLIKTAYR